MEILLLDGWHSDLYYFQAMRSNLLKEIHDCNVLYKLPISNKQSALDGYVSVGNLDIFLMFFPL